MGQDLDRLQAAGAVIVWSVTAARVGMLRSSAGRAYWSALAALAVGQTLQVQAIYAGVEQLCGTPGAAAVIKHAAALIAAANTAAVVATLLPGADRARGRRAWAWAGLALIGSTAPWLLDPPARTPAALAHRAEYFDASWRSLIHWGFFLAYLGWALWTASAVCWRYRRLEQPGPTRTGVTLVGAGTTLGLGYVVEKAVTALAWSAGRGPATVAADRAAEALILGISVALIAVGSSYTAAADRITAARDRRRALQAWRALQPLTVRLQTEFPDLGMPIALTATERLVAAVAAAQEGLRRLTAYQPPPAHAHAHVTDDTGQQPTGETIVGEGAGWLSRALAAKSSGEQPRHLVSAPPLPDTGATLATADQLTALYAAAATMEETTPDPAAPAGPEHRR